VSLFWYEGVNERLFHNMGRGKVQKVQFKKTHRNKEKPENAEKKKQDHH